MTAPESQPKPTLESVARDLGFLLLEGLVQGHGMNDFLHRFLEATGKMIGISSVALYDYHERGDIFDLLYWHGYGRGSRSELRSRMQSLDIRRALKHRDPYWPDPSQKQLMIPLYFQDSLEAVLLLESADRPLELDESRRAASKLASKFLGLFMSSNRLPVNQALNLAEVTDLERAREVQMSYLPSEHPVTDRYEIYGYNQSSALVGGDYFDYFREREKSIQCVVADACGHGMAAALIMSTFRGLLHSEVRRIDELPALFTRLNQQLYSGGELVQYLTCVFFDYDEDRWELQYFNAGHFDPIVVHSDTTSSQLEGGGPPLGMFRDSSYQMQNTRVNSGDLLVLFTDGLVELRDAKDNFFGVEGILNAVSALRHLPLRDLAREVLARAARFSHKRQPDDDLTLFLMRFR